MTAPHARPALTRRRVLSVAWPVVAAQAALALPGVVDTAVMGRVGSDVDLGAVGVAAVTFSFLYWAFGFLRMSTTGLTAQAAGRGDADEVNALLVRGVAVAVGLGVAIWAAFPAVRWIALGAFQAEAAVEEGAAAYMQARVVGAPAALMGFAINGWLLGTGRTRSLLVFQLVLNLGNALFDGVFVGVLGWGPAGIGAGTALAEVLALGVGLALVRDGLGRPAGLWDPARLRAMFAANTDILVRTVAMLGGFAWFTHAGSTVGTAALAGNQVLLQFIAVAAFVLDAFAFIAEKEAGEAVGAGDVGRLRRAMRVTTELSFLAALGFVAAFLLGGPAVIRTFVADDAARRSALAFLPLCAVVPLLGMPAWQLDGVFIGATRGRALRNAALVATGVYIGLDCVLRPALGNLGVWLAFLAHYGLRAAGLAVAVPALFRAVGRSP